MIFNSGSCCLIKEIKSIGDNVDYSKLSFEGGNKKSTILKILRHSKK